MDSILSCVTLSAAPHTRADVPSGVTYVNHVSRFASVAELHEQRVLSINAVNTPNWVWCDDDDPWLWPALPAPSMRVLHGDEVVLDQCSGDTVTRAGRTWDAEMHLHTPLLMHKAVCPTAASKIVAGLLPMGNYWTDHMLYYLLAAWQGATYLPKIVTQWVRRGAGLHRFEDGLGVSRNTVLWLMQNRTSVLAQLNTITLNSH